MFNLDAFLAPENKSEKLLGNRNGGVQWVCGMVGAVFLFVCLFVCVSLKCLFVLC